MKANGSRREEREEKYHGKNQVRPPVGAERKTVGRRGAGCRAAIWVISEVGGYYSAVAKVADLSAFPLGSAFSPRSVAALVGTRSSRSLGRAAPLAPTPAAPRVLVTCPLRLYMSKVLKSVLPIATARVLQPISEPDPTRTPFRVSSVSARTAFQ
ncbi:unnamed protein product [Pieris macdunnoughi]|uniref:Uncharacterized protein n=1 Tax=Pieris macdunnoughi TaxID=345717 RepID=A0A821MSC0_9NEOP|nr:unnamed protein product [Pieris macdunnoughi]